MSEISITSSVKTIAYEKSGVVDIREDDDRRTREITSFETCLDDTLKVMESRIIHTYLSVVLPGKVDAEYYREHMFLVNHRRYPEIEFYPVLLAGPVEPPHKNL